MNLIIITSFHTLRLQSHTHDTHTHIYIYMYIDIDIYTPFPQYLITYIQLFIFYQNMALKAVAKP